MLWFCKKCGQATPMDRHPIFYTPCPHCFVLDSTARGGWEAAPVIAHREGDVLHGFVLISAGAGALVWRWPDGDHTLRLYWKPDHSGLPGGWCGHLNDRAVLGAIGWPHKNYAEVVECAARSISPIDTPLNYPKGA